jgi:hypothetical protein
MAWYVTAGIANVATGAVLFLLALLKKNKTSADKIFILFCGAILQFTVFHLFWQMAIGYSSGAFFGRYLMLGPIFIPILFFHYILTVNGGEPFDKLFLKWGYYLTIILVISLPTHFFIARVEPQRWFPYWTIPGPLLHVHIASYFIFIGRSIFLLRHRFKTIVGLGKEQARYLIAGAVLGFGGGGMNYLAFYNFPVKPYGHVLVFIGEAIVGYAVLRYRLADLNTVLRQALGYLFFSVILAFPSAIILSIVRPSPIYIFVIVFLLVGFLGPWLFETLRGGLLQAVDFLPPFREMFSRFRNIGEVIRGLEKIDTVGDWTKKVIDSVSRIYPVQSANLLVRDHEQEGYLIRSSFGLTIGEQGMLFLPFKSPLVKKFKERSGVLVADLVREVFNSENIEEAKSDLAYVHGAVSLPIFFGGEVFAILNVGPKINGEMFGDLDLAYLGNLAGAAEHRLLVILSGLSREQLTAAWAHDLSKPFNEKGSLGDIRSLVEGKFGSVDDEAKRVLYRIAEEMRFVGKNLRVLISGKDSQFDTRPQNMAKLYQRVEERFLKSAEKNEIELLVHVPEPYLMVSCDLELLEHRVLGNLLENALRHTPKGGSVTVGYRVEGNTFIGFVQDTGPGIKKEDLSALFTPGVQLDPKNKGQAGLGLASVKSVIEAHGGRVWVESEVGKGTTFFFSL